MLLPLAALWTRYAHLMLLHLLLPLLIHHTMARGAETEACLNGLSTTHVSSTTASLGWAYNCDKSGLKLYKVHFTHQRFLSCKTDIRRDLTKPAGFGTLETDLEAIDIHGLHPYSEYEVEVKAIMDRSSSGGRRRGGGTPEKLTTVLRTEFSIPRVRPTASRIDYSYKDTDTRLTFNWSPPLASSDCQEFNAELGDYFYKVRGVSEWNVDYFRENNVSLKETILTVTDLMPASDYLLFLYVTNDAGEFDEDYYLKLEGRTRDGAPLPPRQLAVRSADTSGSEGIHLEWRPPYPPTGRISRYELRWKEEGKLDWLDSIMVEPSNSLCREEGEEVCHTITQLHNRNYTVEVRAFNADIDEPSSWSRVDHLTPSTGGEGAATSTTDYLSIITVLLILALVTLLLLLVVRCWWRRKRRQSNTALLKASFGPVTLNSGPGGSFNTPIIRGGFPGRDSSSSGRQLIPSSDTAENIKENFYTDRPTSVPIGRRSYLDPLPAVPSQEHIYSDIKPKREDHHLSGLPYMDMSPSKDDSLRVERLPQEEEADELAEEEGYLKPNPLAAMPKVASRESLDEEGYLRPNFNRFQRMNTTSPERQSPPPIPAVSYLSGT